MEPIANPDDRVEIFFVGNATTLISYRDITLLTDPNFLHRGQHAYLGHGLASRRLTEPAISARDLPANLDAVVLSHLHGDHWDRVTRRHLDRSLPIITTPHASRRLQALHGFSRAQGLRVWQSQTVAKRAGQVTVTALPGRHAPRGVGWLLPPVMGSLLEFAEPGGAVAVRLYISGDTLMFDGIAEIARRHPDLDLSVLHLGGTTLPGGLLVTMDARQGAEMTRLLAPRRVLPVHYEEYGVMRSPLADFLAEAERQGFADRLIHCDRGERVSINPAWTR
jgi:L-ascorbate metabolism protein UlaG (beta-lactamase superfamily)